MVTPSRTPPARTKNGERLSTRRALECGTGRESEFRAEPGTPPEFRAEPGTPPRERANDDALPVTTLNDGRGGKWAFLTSD